MGYYITLEKSTFVIPAEHLDEALRRLKALNHKPGVEKHGGSWSGGKQTAAWFSWMSEDYDKTVSSAKEVFEQLGFEVSEREDGSISLDYYDNKIGQEELFIREVSDLAVSGWYMDWRGEEGDHWRYTENGTEAGKTLYRSEVEAALHTAYNAGTQS